MKRTNPLSIPAPIARLQEQLNEFRANHPPRTRLPDSVWQAAAALASEHGVYAVAQPLRLDYMGLKRRIGRVAPTGQRQKTPPKTAGFIELVMPAPHRDTCLIEFESPAGGRMRIHWPVSAAPDWAGLLRAWRDAEL